MHQLLWCLEHPASIARYRADTDTLCRRFGLEPLPLRRRPQPTAATAAPSRRVPSPMLSPS